MIEFELNEAKGISIFDVEGFVTWQEIKDAVAYHFAQHPTRDVIWDFRDAEVSRLGGENIVEIVQDLNRLSVVRKNPRTVIVMGGDIWIAELYREISKNVNSPTTYQIVDTRDEALKWLEESP